MAELTKVKKSVMEESQVLPDMAGQSGKVLSNNGAKPHWVPRQPTVDPDLLIPNMSGQSGKILSNNGARPLWISKQTAGRIVGEIVRFSFDRAPSGFFALDGSRVRNGRYDFSDLANCGSRFITVSGNDLVLANFQDFGRGKGSSGRRVGSFEGDAIRNISGTLGTQGYTGGSGTTGPFYLTTTSVNGGSDYSTWPSGIAFNASRQVPTASENRPKSLTELVCIYHGVV